MSTEHEELMVGIAESMRSRFFGKYRGIVTNVEDPEKLGRIVAQVPEVLQEMPSPWALPATPFAGPGHGLVLIPEVGDGVWIEFEAGDPSRPIWTGGWWGPNELPAPGDVQVRALVTTARHKYVLNKKDKETHQLQPSGAKLQLTENDLKLPSGDCALNMSADQI